jgi:hypothetical protein
MLPARTSLAAIVLVLSAVRGGPPGEWTRLSEPTGSNIDEPALARTPDGVLHLVWLRKNGAHRDLVHRAVDTAGRALAPITPIVTDWASLQNPELLVTGEGGLRVFFSGVRGQAPGDPYQGAVYAADATAEGDAWTLMEGGVSHSKSTGAPGCTLSREGPFVAWAAGMHLAWHKGMRDNDPDTEVPTVGCCPYDPSLATESTTGDVVLAWYSNVSRQNGLWAMTLAPSPSAPAWVPGSATADHNSSLPPNQRVPIAARGGGGVYLAYCAGYPSCREVDLWRYESAAPTQVAPVRNTRVVNIAAAPAGRLWVMWADGTRLYATRTNKAATRVGPTVSTSPPTGTQAVWKVKGEGSLGPLDLIVSAATGEGIAIWHTRLLPALSLAASPRSFTAGDTTTVVLQVTDAGDPVAGATISVGDQSGRTDSNGRYVVRYTTGVRPGTIPARAELAGYVPASASITARLRPPR